MKKNLTRKDFLVNASKAAVGASLPPCHTVLWDFLKAPIKSSRNTIFKSFILESTVFKLFNLLVNK